MISGIGIAVGTCALVVVLSIYNGFEDIVRGIYSKADSDLIIYPSKGKVFVVDSVKYNSLLGVSSVSSIANIIEENVFINYDKSQGIALIKGVDSVYEHIENIKQCIKLGDFQLYDGQIPQAIVGRGLAQTLGVMPRFLDPIEIYFPIKGEDISLLNPLSSLRKEIFFPVGIISIEQNIDKEIIFIPILEARRLLGYTNQVSSMEVRLKPNSDSERVRDQFYEILGEGFVIKDKYQQNETVYKMMSYEKGVIYTILLFIILIVSCNVFGSLTMLIIEKTDDIATLKWLGANDRLIKWIFIEEGWLITILGIFVGVILGISLCLIQQYFGVIKMPGNFIINSYPVIIETKDIIFTILGVGTIGLLMSVLPTLKTLPNIFLNIHK